MRGTMTNVKGLGVHRRTVNCKVYYNGTLSALTTSGLDVSSATRNSQGNHGVQFRMKAAKVVSVTTGLGLSAAVAGGSLIVKVLNEGSSQSALSVSVFTTAAASASWDPVANSANWFSLDIDIEESSAVTV